MAVRQITPLAERIRRRIAVRATKVPLRWTGKVVVHGNDGGVVIGSIGRGRQQARGKRRRRRRRR